MLYIITMNLILFQKEMLNEKIEDVQIKIILKKQIINSYSKLISEDLYLLKGKDAKGVININRKFKDFQILRSTLRKRWPGVNIPLIKFPETIIKVQEQYAHSEQQILEKFLMKLSKRQYLWFSQEVQFFLKDSTMKCQKVLSSYSNVSLEEIFYRYKTIFNHLYRDIKSQEEKQIDNFLSYCRKMKVRIKQLYKKTQQLYNFEIKSKQKFDSLKSQKVDVASPHAVGQQDSVMQMTQTKQIRQKESISIQTICKGDLSLFLQEIGCFLFESPSSYNVIQMLKQQIMQFLAFQDMMVNQKEFIGQYTQLSCKLLNLAFKPGQDKRSFYSKIKETVVETIKQSSSQVFKDANELFKYVTLIVLKQINNAQKQSIDSLLIYQRQILQQQIRLCKDQNVFWTDIQEKMIMFEADMIEIKVKNTSS